MKAKEKLRGNFLAALDVGSSKISCFIARVLDEQGAMEIVGVGYQASAGVKNGNIVDIDAAEAAIRQTVHAAENMAAETMKGYPLHDVIINVPGVHAISEKIEIDIKTQGLEVSNVDIRRALAKAQKQVLSEDHELLHTIPFEYKIDGNGGVRDPRGMVGENLEVDIHLVTGKIGPLNNLAHCVERSHLGIETLCLSAYASGLSSLVEDEMDLGCTVIDMGGGVTSFAVFQSGAMIYADAVPLGGWHVSNDIAQGLNTTMTDAERIKTLYGSAIVSTTDDHDMIEVPQIGDNDGVHQNHIPRSYLIGIIQPRLEEILEMVRERLDGAGLGQQMSRRVVLTGGASQIPGLRDLAQSVLNKQIRLGRPIRYSGLADAVSGPAFSTVAGLLTYRVERAHEMPAQIMSQADPTSLWDKVKLWLKENW